MAQFSKPGPGYRPQARPAPSSGAFIVPAGGMRRRGTAEIPGAKSLPPATPVQIEPGEEFHGSRSRAARHDELKLCGLAAVKARFARDPGSIQRLFFDLATSKQIGVICKVLAQNKKVYRCVEPAELEKIAGSIHHGGIVAVVATPALRVPTADDVKKWAKRGEAVLVLDRIGNAHNLGAIARTAAFFGVPRIVIPDDPAAAKPSESAHRVAEGGFENVEVWQTKGLAAFVKELVAAGYDVIGAATRGGRPDAPRDATRKPLALVLGNEEQGLAPGVLAACTRLVTIPGSGKVESLNVSVAAAVLMWELAARR